MNIERQWWFKCGVGILTLISAIALFYYWGRWPIGLRSISGWLIFFFCLLGLQRVFTGIFGVVAITLMPAPPEAGQRG